MRIKQHVSLKPGQNIPNITSRLTHHTQGETSECPNGQGIHILLPEGTDDIGPAARNHPGITGATRIYLYDKACEHHPED